jgi:hypothetical protein
LLTWAAQRDRHYIIGWGSGVEIRTHAGLFVRVGLLGALPALVGAAITVPGERWIGVVVGLACFLVACLFEAVVQYMPDHPWFTF